MDTISIQYIDTPARLRELCGQMKKESWLAVDTEFLREKTYYPQFCLLQIAAPGWAACIDPLALSDLTELLELIYRPDITKVFHSCRQDLEIFHQLTGKVPSPIFDTQVAAPLLGFQDNPGYAMLVSSLLNINLNKAHTRADWSRRPLTADQLQYAADDVIYLCRIYQLMRSRLAQLGRIDWLDRDFTELSDPDCYQTHPENAWMKLKGKNKLTGRQLSIVQVLAEWREKTAQAENKPKNWLLRDEHLFDMAKLQPETIAELAAVRGLSERVLGRHGRELCRLVTEAKTRPPVPLHDKGRPLKKTQQQEAILDVLTALVRVRAEENALNPAILATRRDLEALMFKNDDDCSLMHGWRYSMAGRELLGLIEGSLYLGVEADKLMVLER